jgi:hypothetical protein
MSNRIIALVLLLASAARADGPTDFEAQKLAAHAEREKVAGGVTLGIGLLSLTVGAITFGVSAACCSGSDSSLGALYAGGGLMAVGGGATVAGAVMLGLGFRDARLAQRISSAVPSLQLQRQGDTVSGATASWTFRF